MAAFLRAGTLSGMAEPSCHYCTRPAEDECPTCGRFYCAEHGDDVCLRCLSPEAATPSVSIYRGAILALAVASLVTIFLLVRPPESKSTQDSVRTLATPTPLAQVTATPTRPGSATPTRVPSASATASAAGSATAGATNTPPAGQQTYKIEAGDSLSIIAARFNTDIETLKSLNPGLTELIQIGQEIKVPTAR